MTETEISIKILLSVKNTTRLIRAYHISSVTLYDLFNRTCVYEMTRVSMALCTSLKIHERG